MNKVKKVRMHIAGQKRNKYSVPMINRKFGNLKVVELSHSDGNALWYKCQCGCGEMRICNGSDLRLGKVKRCKKCKKKLHQTHGKKGSSIWIIWMGIKARCNNPNNRAYKNYGGRGIYHDPRWQHFKEFYKDMGDRPKGMQIDRIDNNGPYTKNNCRWVTPKQNCQNRRQKCA